MNVVILTSSNKGSAPIHLIKLVESKKINVKSVIISQGKIKNRRRKNCSREKTK